MKALFKPQAERIYFVVKVLMCLINGVFIIHFKQGIILIINVAINLLSDGFGKLFSDLYLYKKTQ